ncbi:DNA polymerase III subunit alpha [soil metagenome]
MPGGRGFVHLHCHSAWSLLDGAIPAEALPHLAAEAGFDAVALTDHDALTGAVRFARACRDADVKPLYGAELTVAPSPGGAFPGASSTDWSHVTVIAQDAAGYGNLCRLISGAHLANPRNEPHTTPEAIAAHAEGLFVLSGCSRGTVAQLAAAGRMPEAIAAARRWRAAVGPGYRIEIFDHRGRGDHSLRNRLLAVAREAGVPAVAVNDVHYQSPANAATHEVLHAIKEIVPLSRWRSLRRTSERYLKSAREMEELFPDCPEALEETRRIADACTFDLDLGSYHFPEVPIPPGETPTGYLSRRCYEGATHRFRKVTRAVEDRLEHELALIERMGFASYFLLVAEIVEHVRYKLDVRCACRGSAAASLVCYALGISDVDPLRYDLLFERFMNDRREELPDIDLDVESHRREDVLGFILDTYGRAQTAVCCMADTFRARMAIRDVGKALGLPGDEIDLVAKSFPRVSARDIPRAIEHLPELAGSNLDGHQLEQLFSLCFAIDGFPRHLALHPSGVILSSSDLAARVPMQESFGGFTMLQADKDDVEELGLVKLDVLGVRMLSAVAHARDEIERVEETSVDLDRIPRDDEPTWRLIRSSKTLGCFQIESPGQRELLARLAPARFEDLVVDISLFRPGPVKSDMVTPYLERRHGFAGVRFPHRRLAPILAETNGVIVFHEQVIRVIAAVTGCSLGEADHVRRHLDAGDAAEANKGGPGGVWRCGPSGALGRWFVASATGNGYAPEQAARLWEEVASFASFGFCKAHAAAFALPTYVSAYLKAHHPAAFLAGVLTHDPGMYPRRLIVADARTLGIPILPVDVNRSGATYRVENAGGRPGIRLALSEVKDISQAEIRSIERARSDGSFTSLEDLWRRTELSRPVLEHLVHLGAVDGIAGERARRELLWRVIELHDAPRLGTRGPSSSTSQVVPRQLSLTLDEPVTETLSGLPPYSDLEEVEAELEITGIDARRHLMELYTPLVAELVCTPAAGLLGVRNDSEVWVAGVKVSTQTPAIRSGKRIIFLTLDDPTGPMDVTVFEGVQPRVARTVFHSWLLVVRGAVRKRGGASRTQVTDPGNVGVTVVAREVFDLAELSADRRAGHSLAAALGRQRRKQTAAGGALLPRRTGEPHVTGRPWHASGGSAGR